MPLFFYVALAIWLAAHVYVARRLVSPVPWRFLRGFFYTVWIFGYALAPLGFWLNDKLAPPYDLNLRFFVWTYVGAFTLIFATLAVRDLVLLALRFVDAWRTKQGKAPVVKDEERRRFLLNATGSAAVGVTGVLTTLGVKAARKVPAVVRVDVPIKNLPKALDGYHIVQLSDVHVGLTIDKDFILPIVEAVTDLKPDMIALTGDLVDGEVDVLKADVSPLAYLRAPDGILFVTGNHEYYSGVDRWCQHFRELGMTVLNNANVLVKRGDTSLVVAGVPDLREGKKHPGHETDYRKALEGAPANATKVLLAHRPRNAFEAVKHGFHLQLSGHTHGGQYFPWNLFVGMFEPLPTGLSQVGTLQVYVSPGTCYWGPPLRNGVPPEITSLKLRRA